MLTVANSMPEILLLKKEVKVCQGCIVEHLFGYQIRDMDDNELRKIGIINRWFTKVKHGNRMEERIAVRHEKNHPKCYNYVTELVEQVICIDVIAA